MMNVYDVDITLKSVLTFQVKAHDAQEAMQYAKENFDSGYDCNSVENEVISVEVVDIVG